MVLNRGDRFSHSACCRARGVVLLDGPNYDLARSPTSLLGGTPGSPSLVRLPDEYRLHRA